jgi:hypothetical protein
MEGNDLPRPLVHRDPHPLFVRFFRHKRRYMTPIVKSSSNHRQIIMFLASASARVVKEGWLEHVAPWNTARVGKRYNLDSPGAAACCHVVSCHYPCVIHRPRSDRTEYCQRGLQTGALGCICS